MQTEKSCHLSTTQLGTIAETLVSAQLMLVSGGRLSTFVPQADDDGLDLLVLDKLTRKTFGIQVEARYASEETPPGTVQFDTRLKTFREASDAFLLAVIVDSATGKPWRFWLVPFHQLRSVAAEKRDHLIMTPSPSETSSDRYTPWRCHDIGDVVARLTEGDPVRSGS